MSSSMAVMDTAKKYLQLIQELKNYALLGDVSEIKKEIDYKERVSDTDRGKFYQAVIVKPQITAYHIIENPL